MPIQLLIRGWQVMETWRSGGFSEVKRKIFANDMKIVLAVKNLNTIKSRKSCPEDLEFMAVEKTRVNGASQIVYPLRSRQLKLATNLNKGFVNFALVRGNRVIGDVWSIARDDKDQQRYHSDFEWLGINLDPGEAYMFDMYIDPDERHSGLVNILVDQSLMALQKKGIQKSYGFYESDNIPALWMHRSTGYEEIERIRIKRSFFRQQRTS